jgi:hypothetical protein
MDAEREAGVCGQGAAEDIKYVIIDGSAFNAEIIPFFAMMKDSIFMPILRREINDFVQMWNDHSIRKQGQLVNRFLGIYKYMCYGL